MKSTPTYQNYALGLLRFYPRAWRERYANEAAAILEERPATLRTLFDLLLGMLDAYLHNDLFTERKFAMLQKLRNTQLAIFCLSILTMLFWATYQVLHNSLFYYAYFTPGLQQVNYTMIQNTVDEIVNIAGLCALITTLIGSIALIRVALRQTVANERKRFSKLFAAWSFSALGFVIVAALFYTVNYIRSVESVPFMNLLFNRFFLYDAVLLIVLVSIVWIAIIGPLCLLVGARKTEFSPQLLGTTIVPALLTTVAISIMALAMSFLAIEFSLNAPDLSTLKRAVFLDLNVACMVLLAVCAVTALWHGYSAQRKLALA